MAVRAVHCQACGAPLEQRFVEGAERDVCPVCGTIAYRNPLPVASALVLNERRDLLLVKRRKAPQAGMWCLPIGFAEVGETIAAAALRELQEEAGIEGRVLRLLDVDSYLSNHYGDLLIVTFEVEKTAGIEKAGDDAGAVGYFPLDRLPPLAFSSNDRAIEACKRAHADDWAIRDSFEVLEAPRAARRLSDVLASVIRDHADEIAHLWVQELRTHATTPALGQARPQRLKELGQDTLARFAQWWNGADEGGELRDFFRATGGTWRSEGVPLHELLSGLMLLRKCVWAYVRDHGVWRRSIDAYRVLELDRRLVLFFDRAVFHAARGYDEESGRGDEPGEV